MVSKNWTVVGSVQETHLGKAHAFTQNLSEQSISASRVMGSGGRVGSTGSAGIPSLGLAGVPAGAALPSVLATGSPLAIFQYTLSRADRLAMYRYFLRTDPFVARAMELHAELPLSRLSIGQPRGPDVTANSEVTRIYENMTERLGLLQFLLEVAREYWSMGDVYVWMEWDEEIQEWSDLYILPVEYCHSVLHPFMRRQELIIFARPLVDTASIRRMTDRDLYMLAGDPDLERLMEELDEDLPEDLRELLDYGDAQPLNTDPEKGSYCFHLSRNRPPNEAYGQGLVERILETLIRLENLKNAQLQISGRNMQPKHLIFGEALSREELDDLRTQVDLSLLENVDYPIVTNYRVEWNVIGANERLLNVDAEYNTLREDLAAGLGTTKDLITGQATYGGQRITLELMNTQYMTFRELMKDFVERGIFRPIAEAKGHYYYEEIDTWIKTSPEDLEAGDDVIQEYDGNLRKRQVQVNKVYNHSQLRFNRLSIRDNTEVYDQLFQLHQKGSLALRYLLDLHNIDAEENAAALLEDMGTVRDPTFNRLIESLYAGMTDQIISTTNLVDRVIEGLNLDVKSQVDGQPAPGTSPEASLMGGGVGPMPLDSLGGGPLGGDLPGGEMGLPPLEGGELGGPLGLPGTPATVPGNLPGAPAPASSRRESKKLLRVRDIAAKKLSAAVVKELGEAGRRASSIRKRLTPQGVRKIIARTERKPAGVKIELGDTPVRNGKPRHRLTASIVR